MTGTELATPDSRVVDALADDLNTAGAIAVLHELANSGDAKALASSAALLGILTNELSNWPAQDQLSDAIRQKIEQLAKRWREYQRAKNWSAADGIRDPLLKVGVRVQKDGDLWIYENPDMMTPEEREATIEKLTAIEAQK